MNGPPPSAGAIVGIDVGATKWLATAGNIDSNSFVHGFVQDAAELTVDDMTHQILAAFPELDVVGCALAGMLDEAGVISAWPNRPAWSGFPLAGALRRRLGTPVIMADDGVCAAIGEWAEGSACTAGDFLCITFGTGIGSALWLDGNLRPYSPSYPNGLGHFRSGLNVPCVCGRTGCFQAVLRSRGPVPGPCVLRFAQLVADIVLMLDLGGVVLTGGRLGFDPGFGVCLAQRIRGELLGTSCIVAVSAQPGYSAVLGARHIANGFSPAKLIRCFDA